MDVKEAIDDLLHVLDLHRHDYAQEDYIKESFHMAIEALEHTRWIPVSERLPEFGTMVLCLNVDKDAYDERYKNECVVGELLINGTWGETVAGEYTIPNVTHWMPLPKPPEVE